MSRLHRRQVAVHRHRAVWGVLAVAAALLAGWLTTRAGSATIPSQRAGAAPVLRTPAAAAAPAAPPHSRPGFVVRQGTRLFLDGIPYRFTGYNSPWLTGCGSSQGWSPDDAGRDAFFAGLRPNSVVRLWYFPGDSRSAFEKVLATARKYHQKLVVVLGNGVAGCTDSTVKDEQWYRSGWQGTYRSWLEKVIPRYSDDPAIAMWELLNEPGPPTDALRMFFDQAGALVHHLDPNHLLESGTMPPWEFGGEQGYLQVGASPAIDVLSLHEYDQVPNVSLHAPGALDVANELGKPLMIGEFGVNARPAGSPIPESYPAAVPCETWESRASLVDAKLRAYFAYPAVAGALYWSWQAGSAPVCGTSIISSDPTTKVIHDVPLQ